MRGVKRGPKPGPKALSKATNGMTELEGAREHYKIPYDPKSGSYPFKVYKAAEVKDRLNELFFGKCAYCETFYASSAPVDIEHFRPKGAVEGDPTHAGYWWLAMAWENLLPSCIDCNRRRRQVTPTATSSLTALDANARFTGSKVILTGKKDLFPIDPGGTRARAESDNLASEKALLLNPCEDDPDVHLVHHVDPAIPISLLLPRRAPGTTGLAAADPAPASVAAAALQQAASVRGAVSIQVYGLNRLGLVQDRTRILRRLGFLEMTIIELAGVIEALEDEIEPHIVAAVRKLKSLEQQTYAEMRSMASETSPYSSMVKAWIIACMERIVDV